MVRRIRIVTCALGRLVSAAVAPANNAPSVRTEGHVLTRGGETYLPFSMVAHCALEQYPRLASFGVNSLHFDAVFLNDDPQAPPEKESERLTGIKTYWTRHTGGPVSGDHR